MRSAKRVIILSAVLVGLLIWPNIVLANGEDVFGTISLPGIFKYPRLEYKGLTQFLTNIVRLLIVAGGLFALFNIILAGYGFIHQTIKCQLNIDIYFLLRPRSGRSFHFDYFSGRGG